MERDFSYQIDRAGRRLTLSGDIDEITASEMRSAIEKASDNLTLDTTIDLSDLDLLPSAGVAVLATSVRDARLQGATLQLLANQGTIAARVLTVCRLEFASDD